MINSLSSRDRNILALYNKTHELASLLADLVRMQLLTDTTILHISTLGVAPFFVENIPELQVGLSPSSVPTIANQVALTGHPSD